MMSFAAFAKEVEEGFEAGMGTLPGVDVRCHVSIPGFRVTTPVEIPEAVNVIPNAADFREADLGIVSGWRVRPKSPEGSSTSPGSVSLFAIRFETARILVTRRSRSRISRI